MAVAHRRVFDDAVNGLRFRLAATIAVTAGAPRRGRRRPDRRRLALFQGRWALAPFRPDALASSDDKRRRGDLGYGRPAIPAQFAPPGSSVTGRSAAWVTAF